MHLPGRALPAARSLRLGFVGSSPRAKFLCRFLEGSPGFWRVLNGAPFWNGAFKRNTHPFRQVPYKAKAQSPCSCSNGCHRKPRGSSKGGPGSWEKLRFVSCNQPHVLALVQWTLGDHFNGGVCKGRRGFGFGISSLNISSMNFEGTIHSDLQVLRAAQMKAAFSYGMRY